MTVVLVGLDGKVGILLGICRILSLEIGASDTCQHLGVLLVLFEDLFNLVFCRSGVGDNYLRDGVDGRLVVLRHERRADTYHQRT